MSPAKAGFHLRCQKADPKQIEPWLSSQYDNCWTAVQERYPALSGFDQKLQLISDARALIDENWVHVMTMATAYADPSVDVDGREIDFLDDIYYEPED